MTNGIGPVDPLGHFSTVKDMVRVIREINEGICESTLRQQPADIAEVLSQINEVLKYKMRTDEIDTSVHSSGNIGQLAECLHIRRRRTRGRAGHGMLALGGMRSKGLLSMMNDRIDQNHPAGSCRQELGCCIKLVASAKLKNGLVARCHPILEVVTEDRLIR